MRCAAVNRGDSVPADAAPVRRARMDGVVDFIVEM